MPHQRNNLKPYQILLIYPFFFFPHFIAYVWEGGLSGKNMLACCCCCCFASVVSDSVRPHGRQPTRLPRPWDSPSKNTGVVCHFLLQCMKVKSESEGAQSWQTLCDPMDCSLPGSSVHGIFQAITMDWLPFPPPGDGPNPEIKPMFPVAPALQVNS